MKIYNIAELAINLLQLKLPQNALENALLAASNAADGTQQQQQPEGDTLLQTSPEISLLVHCVNTVLADIAHAYIPLISKTRLRAESGGIIPYAAFEKDVCEILKVCAAEGGLSAGARCRFRYRPLHIEVEGAFGGENFDVIYSFKAPRCALDGDAPVGSSRLTERIIAYGTAAEYCLLKGRADDAQVWDKRFKDALFACCCTRAETRLPRRPWR